MLLRCWTTIVDRWNFTAEKRTLVSNSDVTPTHCRRLATAAVLAILSVECSAFPEPPPITTNLLTQFTDAKSFWQQLEVAQKIVKSGDRTIRPDLELRISLEDRHQRGNVAFVFAGFGDTRGFETIRAMLADRSYRPLGEGMPGGSFNTASPNWWLTSQIRADRYYAVHLLGLLRDPRAVDWLVPLLDDADVNYHAAWALGEIGDRRALAPLTAALPHSDALMRTSTVEVIEKLKARRQ